MINTWSKNKFVKIRVGGRGSTSIWIMSLNILVFFLEVTPKLIYLLVNIDINAGITNEATAVKTPFPTCGLDKIALIFFMDNSGLAYFLI